MHMNQVILLLCVAFSSGNLKSRENEQRDMATVPGQAIPQAVSWQGTPPVLVLASSTFP